MVTTDQRPCRGIGPPCPDAYLGKRAVVIGSNNSAHDICAALWEAGADVAMALVTGVVRSGA